MGGQSLVARLMMAALLIVTVGAASIRVAGSKKDAGFSATAHNLLKQLLNMLAAEESHPMSLEEFMPVCLKHVDNLILSVDRAYTDAQLEHTLMGECKMVQAFPNAYDHGYSDQCACQSFSQRLVKSRDQELENGDKSGYKEFCTAFHGHGGSPPECKPQPAAAKTAEAATAKAVPAKVVPAEAVPAKAAAAKPTERAPPAPKLKAPTRKSAGFDRPADAAGKMPLPFDAPEGAPGAAAGEPARQAAGEGVPHQEAVEPPAAGKQPEAKGSAAGAAEAEPVSASGGAGASTGRGGAGASERAPASAETTGAGEAPADEGRTSMPFASSAPRARKEAEEYEERAQVSEEELKSLEEGPAKGELARHWQNMRERGRRYGSQYRVESSSQNYGNPYDDTPPRNKEEWESTAITHKSHHDMPLPVEPNRDAQSRLYHAHGGVQSSADQRRPVSLAAFAFSGITFAAAFQNL